MTHRPPTKDLSWTGDPTGDIANAPAIPADSGVCLLCFGDKKLDYGRMRCPLCKGSGRQTPELVRAYMMENKLDQLVLLK